LFAEIASGPELESLLLAMQPVQHRTAAKQAAVAVHLAAPEKVFLEFEGMGKVVKIAALPETATFLTAKERLMNLIL
jgi:hypothetical protein